MEFAFPEEQVQVADSVARLLADRYPFEQRRAMARGTGRNPEVWRQLAELGLPALTVPEQHGGLGADPSFVVTVGQVLGRALCIEPFLSSTVAAATALRLAAPPELAAQVLPALARGEQLAAYAGLEEGDGHDPSWVETTARREGDAWQLHGRKLHVLHADGAAHIVVTARAGEDGPAALFLVHRDAPGLQLRSYRLVDDTPASELMFSATPATPLGDPKGGAQAIETTQAWLHAAACGDALGVMERAYGHTLDYLKTRQQFGRAIGENQALRHRAAEMLLDLEAARSMAMAAAAALAQWPAPAAAIDIARARLVLTQRARRLCEAAIQLHGAIGMTEEHAVGHCLRRIAVFEQLLGDAPTCAAQLARLLDSAEA